MRVAGHVSLPGTLLDGCKACNHRHVNVAGEEQIHIGESLI